MPFSLDNLHIFLNTHLWWHVALFKLEQAFASKPKADGEVEDGPSPEELLTMREVALDENIRIIETYLWDNLKTRDPSGKLLQDPQVQINVLGLLWRLDSRYAAHGNEKAKKFVETKVAEINQVFTRGLDPLLDVMQLRYAGSVVERSRASADMATAAEGGRKELREAADLADTVLAILNCPNPENVKNEKVELKKMKWNCLGNSWEQRGVIKELCE